MNNAATTPLDEEKLRLMGVDTKVGNFLLYDSHWIEFFEWMIENTSEENILTDQEINEIFALREAGVMLTACEAEVELLDMNQQYPGILSYTESDLRYAKNKLKNHCRLELHYREHYKQCVTLLDRLELEVAELESELDERVNEEKEMMKLVTDQAQYLGEARERRQNTFAQMKTFINGSDETGPVFMAKMPLQNFNDSISLFLKHVDIYVTKNFSSEERGKCAVDRIKGEIEDLKCKWAMVEDQFLNTKLDVIGRANIVEKFLKRPLEKVSDSKLERTIHELSCTNATMDAEFDALLFENQTLLKKAIQAECDLMLFKKYEAKKEKAKQQYETLKFIRGVVSNVLSETELIWIMMKIDLEKLAEYLQALHNVDGDHEAIGKHSAIAVLAKHNVRQQVESFERDVLELQKNYLADHFFISRNIFEITEEIHRDVAKAYCEIKTGKYLQSFYVEYAKLIKLDDALSAYVLDSALERPYLVNHRVLLMITQKQHHRECTQKKITKMMDVYEKNYVCRWKQDQLWATKQMLWVWFVMDKKRAVMAMEEVMRLAKTTPAYAKFNPTYDLMKYN